ncbi:MAG: hypothetical protein BMS9Abin03_335 [Thermodesulfobacteriota bacterium]|nr:MAG: hypothetical protein BMS9Abin03_335 [Thermodesulfobacteriota bacterium]
MKKHRSIIPSATILILLLCFIPQSEGRSLRPLDKIFDGPLSVECRAYFQHPSINLFCNNLQYDNAEDFTPYCNRLNNCYHYDEIFSIHEKSCVDTRGILYIDSSQRSPPLFYNQLNI